MPAFRHSIAGGDEIMAEVWYLNVDTEALEGIEPRQVL